MKYCSLPLAALLFVFLGCNKKEPIPAYLNIQSIDVQGFTDHKITDAWVYADNEFLGTFPLPGQIPILKSGNVKIDVLSGILENGDYQTPNFYPFFPSYSLTTLLTPGETRAIQPVVIYDPVTTVALFDGFEQNGAINWFAEEVDGDPLTRIVTVTDDPFEGAQSAKVTIDTSHQLFEVRTLELENLPTSGGRPCWLELTYKTDFPFIIGLSGAEAGQTFETSYFQQVFPKTEWTKMYVNLTQALALSDFPIYKLAIRARLPLDDKGKPTIISGSMFLDNMRLVYLK